MKGIIIFYLTLIQFFEYYSTQYYNKMKFFNLIINATSLSEAGTYICEEAQTAYRSSAELVVLGKISN